MTQNARPDRTADIFLVWTLPCLNSKNIFKKKGGRGVAGALVHLLELLVLISFQKCFTEQTPVDFKHCSIVSTLQAHLASAVNWPTLTSVGFFPSSRHTADPSQSRYILLCVTPLLAGGSSSQGHKGGLKYVDPRATGFFKKTAFRLQL